MISAIVIVSLLIAAVSFGERVRLHFAFRALFHRRTQFRLGELKPLPTGISLREFRPDDHNRCLAIYAENEVGRFPPDFVTHFEDVLERTDYLKLVLCDEHDVPVAIGGIGLQPYLLSQCGWLVFGLVAPHWQGRGLGVALLVSRVGLLPEPSSATRLFMTNVAKSAKYFERFGFGPQGVIATYRAGLKLPCSSALLNAETWRLCREHVKSLGLTLPEAIVPKIDLRRPAPKDPVQMNARGWSGLSKLNQAVLVQLAGLIGLLIVHRPYNLLGGLLIVAGGVLYRRELKRIKVQNDPASRPQSGD